MKRRTLIIILAVIVVVCGGGFLFIQNLRSQAISQIQNLETATVERGTLSAAVEASGSITARQNAGLSFGTSGTVARVDVEPGDAVKQGQELAALDTRELELQAAQSEQTYLVQQANYSTTVQSDPASIDAAQAAVNSAYAAYLAAKQKYDLSADQITVGCSSLESAKDALDNAQRAYDALLNNWKTADYAPYSPQKTALDNAQNNYDVALANCNIKKADINDSALKSALSQLEQARSNLASLTQPRAEKVTIAQANMEQARLSLELARLRLQNAQIAAPFDGVVSAVNVKAGGPSNASPAIEVADMSGYHVEALIDEIEIGKVQIGQSVEVTLDALPDTTLSGKVTRIDPAGTLNQGVINYKVQIDLDPTDAPIRLDMTANARILGEQHAGVLIVPAAAVRSDDQGTYVLALVQSAPERVAVTVGLNDGDRAEVAGDLKEGTQVLIGELPTLPGARVRFGGIGP